MVIHWEKNGPPVYIAVAGYLGLIGTKDGKKPTGDSKPQSGRPIGSTGEKGNLNDLASLLSGSGGILNG